MNSDKIYRVGDTVRRPVSFGTGFNRDDTQEHGRVVFVHPQGRFFTVQYTFGFGRMFCECYDVR